MENGSQNEENKLYFYYKRCNVVFINLDIFIIKDREENYWPIKNFIKLNKWIDYDKGTSLLINLENENENELTIINIKFKNRKRKGSFYKEIALVPVETSDAAKLAAKKALRKQSKPGECGKLKEKINFFQSNYLTCHIKKFTKNKIISV
ncbi:hypothetical protein BpHYR1_005392 [Brachionus plicatilis]|uniref:Uncharacterized protein n=1 Tax=Brachionus plicatilis TaxID=10195 RepID=A0A3M7R0D8_BRAPC|nr:hypothetical protein BpHYR1_005392 [Brachionus plicatilis]